MDVYSEELVAELEAIAEARLGARATVAKNILRAAPQSESGLEAAVRTIRAMRFPFVDPLDVDYLAEEMEAALAARTGRPATRYGPTRPVLAADPTWTQWAPAALSCASVVLAGLAFVVAAAVLAIWT